VLRFDYRLPQRLECQIAIQPAKALAVRSDDLLHPVRVRAMQTRFQRAIRFFDVFLIGRRRLSKPEFSLLRSAGEDDIGELLNFSPGCCIGIIVLQPGSAVIGASGHGDQAVIP
jgi:hypothetical protein